MSTALWTTFSVLAFLASLALHEAAHARALRSIGGDIRTAGLGLPVFPCLRLRPTARRSWTLTLSPWLLGAYVEPDEGSAEVLEKASYRDNAWFAAAGVIANGVVGLGLLAVYGAIQGRWTFVLITAAITAALWFGRRLVAAYLVPFIGVAAVAVVISAILSTPATEAQGVLGTAQLLVVSTPLDMLLTAGLISISLAVLNCLPLAPFDGGRVVSTALTRTVGRATATGYQAVTAVLSLAFIAYALFTDVWSVIA